jgi:hypothetical protein
MWSRGLALALVLALGACGPAPSRRSRGSHRSSRAKAHRPPPPAPKAATARTVLRSYLGHMLAGRYAAGWTLLSPKKRGSRADYVREWKATDDTREQLARVRKPTYRVVSFAERKSGATAIVELTTAIGVSRIRFGAVLEGGRWWIDPGDAWDRVD